MYLLIMKDTSPESDGFNTVYGCATLEDAVRLIGDARVNASDISHRVDGTGRWDSEDRKYTVITREPEE